MKRTLATNQLLLGDPMLDVSVPQKTEEPAALGGTADVVIGLLSYNSAESVATIARNARDCLQASFPGSRGVIVSADGGSSDGSQERAALAAGPDDFVKITYPLFPAQKALPEQYGVPGKLNALQALLNVAGDLNAAACVVIDCNTSIPAAQSVETLVRPVLENGIDFVTPCYLRHKYDAGILNGIIYPLTRALYGERIHQTIGGDIALSGKLVKYLLTQPRSADGDSTMYTADAWVTIQALTGRFQFGEASLGPRLLIQHEPAVEVSSMLSQSVGAVFAEMNRTAGVWQRIRGSQPIPAFGPRFEPLADSPPVDPLPLFQAFQLGYRNLRDIYRLILPPATLVELKRMSSYPGADFHFDNTLWARIVYDFALAWRTRDIGREHLLGALTPLYLGWVASWVRAVRDLQPGEAQNPIETLCLAYEIQKGYLISRWRWPDSFNP